METLHETIRTLRNQLRLAMNGVTATSMREKGLRYKLNFGVSYPEIKAIARQHEPNATLAHALWAEDCRELKILATLLQPAETFLPEEALRWIAEAPYPEIVELLSKHLLARLPYVEELLATAYDRTDLPCGRDPAILLPAAPRRSAHPTSPPPPLRRTPPPHPPTAPIRPSDVPPPFSCKQSDSRTAYPSPLPSRRR